MKSFNKLALFAGVAELADAQDLGSCGRKAVQVQLLSPAPMFRARKSKLERRNGDFSPVWPVRIRLGQIFLHPLNHFLGFCNRRIV